MMYNLDAMQGNEDLGLLGVGEIENLLGRAGVPASAGRRKLASSIKKSGIKQLVDVVELDKSSRGAFLQRIALLPSDLQEAIIAKRAQVVDHVLYSVKDIAAATSVDMFLAADTQAVGLRNISNAKLEKDTWFMLSAIRVQTGTYVTAFSNVGGTSFGAASAPVVNGDLKTLAVNSNPILLTRFPMKAFDTAGNNNTETGLVKLASPKLIEPQKKIDMLIEFAAAAAALTAIRVDFYGSTIIPA